MSQKVLIKKGIYGKDVIENQVFLVTKPYDAMRGYITVWGSKEQGLAVSDPRNCRVKVKDESHFELIGDNTIIIPSQSSEELNRTAADEFFAAESETEAMDRIKRTFEILEELTDAAAQGIVRGMVVCGPPGIGKSFGVERVLTQASMFAKIADVREKFTVMKGAMSSLGLYRTLYNYSNKDDVVVFDDCDSVLYDEECLNLLKSALDSGEKRKLCWSKESRVLADEGIPNQFEFKGSVIFLTNISFDKSRGKLADHLAAIKSRCHYLDLEISTQRDQILRIKQIVREGMLASYAFSKKEENEVVNFVIDNADYMLETSLRMVKKVADLRKAMPTKWEELAEATCLKRSFKFERMLKRKHQEA